MIKLCAIRIGITALAVILLLSLSVAFIGSTETGTRWIWHRATPFLPDALGIDDLSGTLLTGLHATGVSWRDESVIVDVESLSLSHQLRPLLWRHLSIGALRAQNVTVTVQSNSNAPESAEPLAIDLPLRITLEDAQIANLNVGTAARLTHIDSIDLAGSAVSGRIDLTRFNVSSDWLELSATNRLELLPPYPASVSLTWSLREIVPMAMAGELHLEGDSSEYRIRHLLSSPGDVQSNGTLRLDDGDLTINLVNSWNELDFNLADDRRLRSSQGTLRVSGSPQQYQTQGNASIQIDSFPESQASFDGRGDLTMFEASAIRIDSAVGSLTTAGAVNWDEGLRWNATFDIADLLLDEVLPEFTGIIAASGSSRGQISEQSATEIQVTLDQLSGTINDHPLDGAVVLSTDGQSVDVTDTWVSVRDNRFEGSGTIGSSIDVDIEWDAPDISFLLPQASGRTTGDVRVQHSGETWMVAGQIDSAELAWQDFGVTALKFDGHVATAGSSDATLIANNIRIEDTAIDQVDARLAGVPDAHTIDVDVAMGERRLVSRASGEYADAVWAGEIETLRVVDGNRSTWNNNERSSLRIANAGIDLDELCVIESLSASSLCAAVQYERNEALEIDATLDGLPLDMIPMTTVAENVSVDGVLNAQLGLVWRDQVLNGSGNANVDNAKLSTDYEGETIDVELQNGKAQFGVTNNELLAEGDLSLSNGGMGSVQLRVRDITNESSDMSGMASIELSNLDFVPLLLPDIANTQGTINGNLEIAGTRAAPVLGGDLRLENGAFQAMAAGVSVSDVDLRVRQSSDGQLSLSGAAKSGDGSIKIDGDSRIQAGTGLTATASITGDNFAFVRLPEWEAVASPDLTLTLNNQTARIRGRIGVPEAKITLDLLPETAERPSNDAIVHGREDDSQTAKRQIDVDIEANLGDAVQLTGFGLDTKLTGSLRLRGGSNDPFIGTGRIDLQDGSYEAYGQTLDIESGALLFAGPLENPTFDVRASRSIRDVTAGINLSGTPTNLQSTVFSEPPLSDAEALSYLIAGRPLSAANDEQSRSVGQAAFALGLTGAEEVIAQIQTKLGLDSLALESGEDTGRIVAGRRIGGRLMVEYGYGLVDRLGTLLLRYQLNDYIVVETTTGTANTMDVVYSIKKE